MRTVAGVRPPISPFVMKLALLAAFAALITGVAPRLIHQDDPSSPSSETRPLAADIQRIDETTPLPANAWPTSPHPAGGMLYVRCTNLWSALPDGSGAHRLLSMPGLSSPAFATTARFKPAMA